jgi:ubiquinone biosynthesis protein
LIENDLTPTPIAGKSGGRPIEVRPATRPSKYRSLLVLRSLGGFLVWLGGRWFHGRPPAIEMARALRARLEALGGLWIKLGQLVAMRRDLLPNDFCNELGRLQDRAAGFPGEVSKRIIEDDLGVSTEELFDDFEQTPFAAASIGQLHRARLKRGGALVAIKVQRPFIRAVIEHDLALVRTLCHALHNLGIARNFHWRDLTRELSGAIREELDYRLEAASIDRMRRLLKDHGVSAPQVFPEFSTERVLVMEFVHGVLMSDFIALRERDTEAATEWLEANQIDPEKVGRKLHISLLRQMLEDNLFHGDLHPGNILLLRKSGVALIDFGSIGTLEVRFQEIYRRMLQSMSDVDFEKTADLMSIVTPPTDGRVDWDAVRRNAAAALRKAELRSGAPNLEYSERSMSRALLDVVRSQAVLSAPVGWAFMRVDRAHVTLDSSLMYLVPQISYFTLGQSYFARVNERTLNRDLWGKLNERLRSDRTLVAFQEVVDLMTLAQGAINTSFQRSKRHGEIVLEFSAGVLGLGMLAAAFVIGAVLGARHLPPTLAEPFAVALPRLTAAAPQIPLLVGLLLVVGLVAVALRLIAVERSFTTQSRG